MAVWLAPTPRSSRSCSVGKSALREPATRTPWSSLTPNRVTATCSVPPPNGSGIVDGRLRLSGIEQRGQHCPHRLDVGGGGALAADDFDRPLPGNTGQPDVDEIERQGVEQHVGQAAGDPLRAEAGPDGGQGREGDQIPHRPPQAAVLFKGIRWLVHVRSTPTSG